MTKMLNIFKSYQRFEDDINPTPRDTAFQKAPPTFSDECQYSATGTNILSPYHPRLFKPKGPAVITSSPLPPLQPGSSGLQEAVRTELLRPLAADVGISGQR